MYIDKDEIARRYVESCSFLTEKWEKEMTHKAIVSALVWGEQHTPKDEKIYDEPPLNVEKLLEEHRVRMERAKAKDKY